MLLKSVAKGFAHPSLFSVLVRRFIVYGDALQDSECMNLVQAWSSGRLPRLSIQEIFPGIKGCDVISLRKPEARAIGASLDLQELVHAIAIIKHTHARRILEVGTFDGFTALNIAANLDEEGEVYTLDLPQNSDADPLLTISNAAPAGVAGSKFAGEPEARRIRQLWGDSTTSDWSCFGSPFDLILIDGSHEYQFVRTDTANALKHIAPQGTVLWHDYGQFPDVSRAVDEFAGLRPIGIIRGTRLACFRNT